jgi:diacylglycerol kinase family enzyme
MMDGPTAPSASPKCPVLIVNPRSGGGKAERSGLVHECGLRGIEAVVLAPGDRLRDVVAAAVERGADMLGVAGGDGSQAVVAAAAATHDILYVCIPAGTRNHFAFDLGIDRSDIRGALDAFDHGVERRIDLGSVNGRVFVNNASMGLYAKIVQSPEYRAAKLKTAAQLLPDMLGPSGEPFDLRFTGPDGVPWPDAHVLLVSNDPYRLERLGAQGTREHMNSGTLGVIALHLATPEDVKALIQHEVAGAIRTFPGWREWTTTTLEVDSGASIDIALDGEALVMEPPLRFESLPGALRVRIPAEPGPAGG